MVPPADAWFLEHPLRAWWRICAPPQVTAFVCPRTEDDVTDSEINALFAAKVEKGIFRPVLRHVTGSDPEERLAEAVALVFEMFRRYARRGVLLDDPILVVACRRRAVDLGRYLVHGEQRKRDVLDPRNYTEGRVQVLRVDGLTDEGGDFHAEEDPEVVVGLRQGLAYDPTPVLVSAIDLQTWVAALPDEDRAVLAARYAGNSLAETGAVVGCSTSAAFSKLRRLGAELAARAGVSLRRKPRKARARVLGHGSACPA
jgi:DNA-directed RNA polymerase specialized sigma24 family protein